MSHRWLCLTFFVCGGLIARADDASKDLSVPTKVLAAGKGISLPGGAPFVGDFQQDGSQTLLVGQSDGKLRVYRGTSAGSKADLRFDSYTMFQDGKTDAVVPSGADSGFVPVLVSRGDAVDLWTGSSNGEIFVYRGKDKGKFGPRETIKDKTGKPIQISDASTVFPADWRGVGKLDLLIGSSDGSVYLVPNEGSATGDSFGTPKQVEADGKPIKVSMGHSHPVVADWDKDGKPDLIVGTGAGSVLWYRNIGTRESPKLAAAQTLVPESPLAKSPNAALKDGQHGLRAKVSVVDWNNDGQLDLLVGDWHGKGMDNAAATKAKEEVAKLKREHEAAAEKLRGLEKAPAKETPKAKQEREKELQTVKQNASRLEKELQDAEKQLKKQETPAGEAQGQLWLFLRKAAKNGGAQ